MTGIEGPVELSAQAQMLLGQHIPTNYLRDNRESLTALSDFIVGNTPSSAFTRQALL